MLRCCCCCPWVVGGGWLHAGLTPLEGVQLESTVCSCRCQGQHGDSTTASNVCRCILTVSCGRTNGERGVNLTRGDTHGETMGTPGHTNSSRPIHEGTRTWRVACWCAAQCKCLTCSATYRGNHYCCALFGKRRVVLTCLVFDNTGCDQS